MAQAERRIRVTIDSSGAQQGAARVNSALASINAQGPTRQFQGLAGGLNAANNNAAKSSGIFGSLADKFRNLTSATGGFGGALGGLGGLAAAGGIAAIGLGVVAIGKQIFDATAKVQSFKASLTTVIGDADKAGMAFDRLAAFAAKTPFSLDQSVQGFVKLKALGLTPSEAAMTSYGNTAAAMGKDLNQMIEAVADASTLEFERLKEFGIKSKQEGDKVSFTFQGVTTTVGKSAGEIEGYLQGIGNNQFAGAMERQSKTISGALSNLKDQIFLTFAEMGEGGVGEAFQDILNGMAGALANLKPLLGAISGLFGGLFGIVKSVFGGLLEVFSATQSGSEESIGFIDTLTITFNLLGEAAGIVASLIGDYLSGVATVVQWVVGKASELWSWLMSKLGIETGATTQGMILSFVGILRGVKYVALNIPKLFQSAIGAVGNIFGILGSRIKKFFDGNFDAFDGFGGAVRAQLASVGKTAAGIGNDLKGILGDAQGSQAALDRLRVKGGGGDGPSLSDLAGPTPSGGAKPSGAGGGRGAGAGGESAAEKAAKALEDANAKYGEFLSKMTREAELAKMLKHESEMAKVIQEGKDILGERFTEIQQTEITNALKLKRINEALGALDDKAFKLANENAVMGLRRLGLTEKEAKIEDEIAKARIDFLNSGGSMVEFETEAWQLSEKRLRTELGVAAAMEAQRDRMRELSADIGSLYEDYARSKDPRGAAIGDRQARDAKIIDYSINNPDNLSSAELNRKVGILLTGSAAEFDETMRGIADEFHDNMINSIHQIGDALGGKFGEIINGLGDIIDAMQRAKSGDWSGGGALGGIASLFGGPEGNRNPFGAAVQDGIDRMSGGLFEHLGKPVSSMSDSFKGLKASFGPNGSFTQGLGNAVGGAMQGAQIGSAVAGVGKLFWDEFSTTGAQIGGALGSAFGPLGSLAGSVIGGTIGGLLKKPKYATEGFELNEYGEIASFATAGKGKDQKEASAALSAQVAGGLNDIAARLGGSFSGAPNLTIGMYKDRYKVNTQGYTGKLKNKVAGTRDFLDDAEGAVAFAIQESLRAGILTGVSDFTARTVKSAGDNLERVLSTAEAYETVLDDLDLLRDPLKGGAKSVTESVDTLIDQMKRLGATSADLASVEEYRQLKLTEYMDNQLSGLKAFRDDLMGEQGGYTALSVLTRDLDKFATMRADINSGKAIDQDAFTELGQAILGNASEVYGSGTTDFANIRNMLFDATNGLIANTQTTIDDATTVAVQEQTAAVVGQIGITNDLLRQLLENGTTTTTTQVSGGAQNGNTFNGRQIAAY